MLSNLREVFWIIKGKTAVRSVIGKCAHCKRANATPSVQMMANPPEERMTPDKPSFTSLGVDYFGPINVRQGRRHVERYIPNAIMAESVNIIYCVVSEMIQPSFQRV